MSSDKKDILKALDEMEQTSHEINSRKARVEARIQKHVKPKVEPTREEVIKMKKDQQDVVDKFTNKTYLFKTALMCLIAVIACFIHAEGDRVNFVRNIIVCICLYGIYLMKR